MVHPNCPPSPWCTWNIASTNCQSMRPQCFLLLRHRPPIVPNVERASLLSHPSQRPREEGLGKLGIGERLRGLVLRGHPRPLLFPSAPPPRAPPHSHSHPRSPGPSARTSYFYCHRNTVAQDNNIAPGRRRQQAELDIWGGHGAVSSYFAHFIMFWRRTIPRGASCFYSPLRF